MQTVAQRVPADDRVPPSCSADLAATVAAEPRSTMTAGTMAADHAANGQNPSCSVVTGGSLFSPGDKRRLYRVESGAVCHFARWPDGRLEVIAFAFPGDLIGFGYLSTHTSSAVAMVDTVVSSVSDAALSQAMAHDSLLAFSFAEAGEREFEYLRMTTRVPSVLPPVQALARYLLAITSVDASEGRGGLLAADDVASDYVAGLLHMPRDVLSMALLSLCRSGAVAMAGKGWRVTDAGRLEALAQVG